MARWTSLATWVGHTINEGDGDGKPLEAQDRLAEVRGVVLHIASGFYEGTMSWQRNASADVSSHFIVGRDGRCAQMVDTADRAWAQRSGNGSWLSVELEGFAPDDALHKTHPGWERLTDAQVEVCAELFAQAHREYGAAKVPLQLASSPAGRGLGHHSMGAENGYDWGHSQCPGVAIKAQKPTILARAKAIVSGTPLTGDNDMALTDWTVGKPAGYRDDQLTQGTLEQDGSAGDLASGHYGKQQRDTALAGAAESSARAAKLAQQILEVVTPVIHGSGTGPSQAQVTAALSDPAVVEVYAEAVAAKLAARLQA